MLGGAGSKPVKNPLLGRMMRKETHPGPLGHPSREGNFSYPLLGGVARERRGGFPQAGKEGETDDAGQPT